MHNPITSLLVYFYVHWLCLHVSTERVNKSHHVDNLKHCLSEGWIKFHRLSAASSMCDLCLLLLTLGPGQNNDWNGTILGTKHTEIGRELDCKKDRYGEGHMKAPLAPKRMAYFSPLLQISPSAPSAGALQ